MRIALATVGTTGDVRPFATLARRLVERGHDVTAISWPVHRTALSQSGVQVEVAGPHADPGRIASVAAAAAERGPMEQVAILRDFHLADGESHYRRLRELLPGNDLVLLHGVHALAQAAAMDVGIPWATAAFDPVLMPTASAPPPGMPSLGPGNRLLWGMLDRMLQRTSRPLDDILQRAGSSQRGLPLFRARSPLLHLVACSPAVMRVPPDLPPGTHVTGAWMDRSTPPQLPGELQAFLADGPPPVAITFGSMEGTSTDELGIAVRAMLDAGRRIVLQGRGEETSPNLLRIGAVDHRALFPAAALVVHHGGAGTTHAAVAAGVPSVVVPHVGDQRYWADRLHRLGVAPAPLPARGLSGARLAEVALATASNPRFRDAVGPLAAALTAEDGVAAAVSLLERAAA